MDIYKLPNKGPNINPNLGYSGFQYNNQVVGLDAEYGSSKPGSVFPPQQREMLRNKTSSADGINANQNPDEVRAFQENLMRSQREYMAHQTNNFGYKGQMNTIYAEPKLQLDQHKLISQLSGVQRAIDNPDKQFRRQMGQIVPQTSFDPTQQHQSFVPRYSTASEIDKRNYNQSQMINLSMENSTLSNPYVQSQMQNPGMMAPVRDRDPVGNFQSIEPTFLQNTNPYERSEQFYQLSQQNQPNSAPQFYQTVPSNYQTAYATLQTQCIPSTRQSEVKYSQPSYINPGFETAKLPQSYNAPNNQFKFEKQDKYVHTNHNFAPTEPQNYAHSYRNSNPQEFSQVQENGTYPGEYLQNSNEYRNYQIHDPRLPQMSHEDYNLEMNQIEKIGQMPEKLSMWQKKDQNNSVIQANQNWKSNPVPVTENRFSGKPVQTRLKNASSQKYETELFNADELGNIFIGSEPNPDFRNYSNVEAQSENVVVDQEISSFVEPVTSQIESFTKIINAPKKDLNPTQQNPNLNVSISPNFRPKSTVSNTVESITANPVFTKKVSFENPKPQDYKPIVKRDSEPKISVAVPNFKTETNPQIKAVAYTKKDNVVVSKSVEIPNDMKQLQDNFVKLPSSRYVVQENKDQKAIPKVSAPNTGIHQSQTGKVNYDSRIRKVQSTGFESKSIGVGSVPNVETEIPSIDLTKQRSNVGSSEVKQLAVSPVNFPTFEEISKINLKYNALTKTDENDILLRSKTFAETKSRDLVSPIQKYEVKKQVKIPFNYKKSDPFEHTPMQNLNSFKKETKPFMPQ
jgi:hypothetical protein